MSHLIEPSQLQVKGLIDNFKAGRGSGTTDNLKKLATENKITLGILRNSILDLINRSFEKEEDFSKQIELRKLKLSFKDWLDKQQDNEKVLKIQIQEQSNNLYQEERGRRANYETIRRILERIERESRDRIREGGHNRDQQRTREIEEIRRRQQERESRRNQIQYYNNPNPYYNTLRRNSNSRPSLMQRMHNIINNDIRAYSSPVVPNLDLYSGYRRRYFNPGYPYNNSYVERYSNPLQPFMRNSPSYTGNQPLYNMHTNNSILNRSPWRY